MSATIFSVTFDASSRSSGSFSRSGVKSDAAATRPLSAPNAKIEGVMLQPQLTAVGEVLVGLRRDAAVGPVITVGMGGIAAEIYRDIALRIAPVSPNEAMAMFEEIRGFALLRGFRGRPRGDLAALAEAVSRLSQLCADGRIAEAEINPVLVMSEGRGVVAVDGLVVLAS